MFSWSSSDSIADAIGGAGAIELQREHELNFLQDRSFHNPHTRSADAISAEAVAVFVVKELNGMSVATGHNARTAGKNAERSNADARRDVPYSKGDHIVLLWR
jgi:hypothetical protein